MYRLGIDLGGTNIAVGVIDENFKVVGSASRKTAMPRPADAIVDDMVATAFDAISDAGISLSDIESFGVGAPGAVDPKTGVVLYANNLDCYDLPLSDMLKERMGVHFFVENDANAAAYGEFIAGAGKGSENFVVVTLGTGVGGGIIIGGKIYGGTNHAGAEIGCTVIMMNGERCSCGRLGCFEAYASVTALIRQTKQAMTRYPDSIMWQLCERDLEKVSGRTSFDAMRLGDYAAKTVVDKYIEFVSTGVANMINIFQPDILCIGGGISKEGDTLIQPVRDIVAGENYARSILPKTEIRAAALGNDAGIIGAACLSEMYK